MLKILCILPTLVHDLRPDQLALQYRLIRVMAKNTFTKVNKFRRMDYPEEFVLNGAKCGVMIVNG